MSGKHTIIPYVFDAAYRPGENEIRVRKAPMSASIRNGRQTNEPEQKTD